MRDRSHIVYLGLTAISLALALLHYEPMRGSMIALVVTVLLQFYLPGYLLARVLEKHHTAHPISRFAWILVCAFALNVCLGGAARLLGIPMSAYVVLLHSVMMILIFSHRPPKNEPENSWRFELKNTPLYALVLLCCGIVLFVGVERSQFRFNGFEDQTVFISLADWLANDPDDPLLRSRRIGVTIGDSRWDTDGWTYTHAAWIWSSGYPAAQLIWHDLTWLFVWTIPLAIYALVYEITRRETTAAWSVAALVLFGLMTLDSLVYYPTTLAFGQFSLFQVNSLRTIATALMTPLALMAAFASIRQPKWQHWLIAFLAALALTTMHPRQILILLYSVGGTLILWWLAKPFRPNWKAVAIIGLAVTILLGVPVIQRLQRPVLRGVPVETEDADPRGEFLTLENLPIIGTTFIVSPATVFYHPVIAFVGVLGVLSGLWWRKNLAAQYAFSSTLLTLILLFTPGLTALFTRFVSAVIAPGMVFALPVALILGLTIDTLLERIGQKPIIRLALHYGTVAIAAIVMLTLLFEPIPIPASARDQIHASNLMQGVRNIRAWDEELVAALTDILPNDERSVLIAPDPGANFIIESIPQTFITGGRSSSNYAAEGNDRFFAQTGEPWLDTTDLEFIAEWGVTHIVLEADDTRLAQLMLQPNRFELLNQPAGFFIFRVLDNIAPNEIDDLFAQMNALYAEQNNPRWRKNRFDLAQPGDPAAWESIAEAWETMPNDSLRQLGAAFTTLMSGQNSESLALWKPLHADYPDIPLFAEAVAWLDTPGEGAATLLTALDSEAEAARVQAARTLLTPDFYHLLDAEQLAHVLAVTENHEITWTQLAEFDADDDLRRRIVLLMSRQQWQTAERWSYRLPEVQLDPRDLMTRSALALVQGNTVQAEMILEQADDADYYAANIQAHPDRWVDNIAAREYELLRNKSSSADSLSPLTIATTRELYVMQPEIRLRNDSVTVAATYGNPHITPFPVQTWRIQIASPDTTEFYGVTDVPATFDPVMLTRTSVTLKINEDNLPPLTPALVFIEPRYDNRVTFGQAVTEIVLNRPPAAQPNPAATRINQRFGDFIRLDSQMMEIDDDALNLTLYWLTEATPPHHYQVFVHVLNEAGELVAQRDSAPVDGRYPTGFWRTNTLIEDLHTIPFESPLPAGAYEVSIGLYSLPDGTRLALDSGDDSLIVSTFEIE